MNFLTGIDTERISTTDNRKVCSSCGAAYFSAVCESCLLGFALGGPVADVQEFPSKRRALDSARSFGSYAVLEELGRGGMGVIYRAVHRDTGDIVALKTVLQEYVGCTETRTRFARETEAASSLDHPNVMPIYEVGEGDDNVPYFCMKLAESGSLHHLKEKYRGRWRQIVELMIKIAEGVHHAHESGVLHRDLKPGNILFTDQYEPLVTDFGLAKRITTSDVLTQSCSILGTPSYIAPEQASGKTNEITVSTDVYGLGAIFYELLTGRPPFIGENPLDVLRQVLERSPKRPRQILASVPRTLETVCWRCLRRLPKERYDSAQALAGDLKRWLNGQKIAPPPSRIWPVAVAWLQKPIGAWSTLALILTVAFGTVWRFAPPKRTPVAITPAAIMIEDWSEDGSLAGFAQKSSDELKRGLAQALVFSFGNGQGGKAFVPGAAFNAIAFGRSNNAQVVFTRLRQTLWQNCPLNHATDETAARERWSGDDAIALPKTWKTPLCQR